METIEKLNEILDLILKKLENNEIRSSDLITISEFCITKYNEDIENNKEFNEFVILDLREKIPHGEKYVLKFDNDNEIGKYKTTLEITENDLQDCINNENDLSVYFFEKKGKLHIALGNLTTNKSGPIMMKLDNYSKNNNGKYGCPDNISIPYVDLQEVYDAITNTRSNAKAYLKTAVNLSNNPDTFGRVSLVMHLDNGLKSSTYYDTFCLNPPGGC